MPQSDIATPRTKKGAIDRAAWKKLQVACKHDASLFNIDGREGIMCNRCKIILHF